MTSEQEKVLRELSESGYAVVIFDPDELNNANASYVEDRLVELGWEVIEDLN